MRPAANTGYAVGWLAVNGGYSTGLYGRGAGGDDVGLVTAGLLGVVQGRVGGGEHVGELPALAVEGGHADGDSEPDDLPGLVFVVNGDGHGRDMGAKALRYVERVNLARLRQQDRELFAAEPPGQVVGAQLIAQRVGDSSQRLVSRQVTVGVVDHLEVIDVDQRER